MTSNARSLFSNTSALFAIQIANYILPFLLIPYLTRVLGVEGYGIVAFGLAIVQIAYVITDYGFSLSATYQIAKQQDNKPEIRRVVSAVMLCKMGLLLPATIALSLFILFQEKYAAYQAFFWLLLLPIIGQTFQPIWFFQGIERMTFITLYTVASRLLYLVLTVCWVTSQSDHHWVAIANGLSAIAAAAIGIGAMLKLGYWPTWCGWAYVRQTFKESTEFFWSRAAVATYTAGGAFFLGLVSTPTQVAYYSAAEQLYKGAQSFVTPISQALYPHMAKHRNFPLFFKVLRGALILGASGLIVGSLAGKWILMLIFGVDFTPAYPLLVIFMTIFIITTPSILLGYPFLGALGNSKPANSSVIIGSVILLNCTTVIYFLSATTAYTFSLSVFLAELVVLSIRAHHSFKLYKSSIHEKDNENSNL